MALPANVDTGIVSGRFIVGVIDGPDADDEPDAIPAKGTVTFTASVPYLPNPGASTTILKAPIVAVLDGEGWLCVRLPDGTAGARGVRLIATDDEDLSVTGWTWTVSYTFGTVDGTTPRIASHSMALPSGATIDLTSVVKVPSSAGIGIEQAEALAATAQAAAQEASQAAQAAAEAAQATDVGIASFVADPATRTRTELDPLYRRSISVTEYGATGDGVTDDAPAIRAAINDAASLGGGEVTLPSGTYLCQSLIDITSGVHLRGASAETTKFVVTDPSRNAILSHADGHWIEDVTVSDIGFVGLWDTVQSEVAAMNGFITMKNVRRLRIERCVFRNSRGFVINVNECDDVIVADNVMDIAPRDMIAVWGTPNVRVTGNHLSRNDDDGISISWNGSVTAPPVRSQIVVTGNQLEDTGPIRMQAPAGAIIANNSMFRTKGMGIRMSVLNFSETNTGTGQSVIISGNVIRDVIDRNWNIDGTASGGVNQRCYINIESTKPQPGDLPSTPGQPAPDGTITAPYGNNYTLATIADGAGPLRMPHGIIVQANVCKRTLPAVAKYSDWGYGPGYSKNGWRDWAITDTHLHGMGVKVSLPIQSALVSDNVLEPGYSGVHFAVQTGVTLADRLAQGVVVRGNMIRDCLSAGIAWTQANLTHQDIQLLDNRIDCDPNFLAAARVAGGKWSAGSVTPAAISVSTLAGVHVARNTVLNAAVPIVQGSAAALQLVRDNVAIYDPATGAGIRAVPSDATQWHAFRRDSNPASAAYGHTLTA